MKLKLVLILLLLFAVLGTAARFSGFSTTDLGPPTGAAPPPSSGEPFSVGDLELATGSTTTVSSSCQSCSSLLHCLACLDQQLVGMVKGLAD